MNTKIMKIGTIAAGMAIAAISATFYFCTNLHWLLPGVELAIGYGLTTWLALAHLIGERTYMTAHGENATARKTFLLGLLVLVQISATVYAAGQSTITVVRDLEILAFAGYAMLAKRINQATPQAEF